MWLNLVIQLLPVLFGLMQIIEKKIDEPAMGPEKKAFVKAAIGSMVGISTGGQKETWERIEGIIDPLIDLAASFLFPKGG